MSSGGGGHAAAVLAVVMAVSIAADASVAAPRLRGRRQRREIDGCVDCGPANRDGHGSAQHGVLGGGRGWLVGMIRVG